MKARVSIFSAPSTICARCDGAMVTTYDAIGRERHRCPHCDGVAARRPTHPDDAMIPQGLVRALPAVRVVERIVERVVERIEYVTVPAEPLPAAVIIQLPDIAQGELRCQLCANGVPITSRLCSECAPPTGGRTYDPRACGEPSCGAVFVPTGPRSLYCEACR